MLPAHLRTSLQKRKHACRFPFQNVGTRVISPASWMEGARGECNFFFRMRRMGRKQGRSVEWRRRRPGPLGKERESACGGARAGNVKSPNPDRQGAWRFHVVGLFRPGPYGGVRPACGASADAYFGKHLSGGAGKSGHIGGRLLPRQAEEVLFVQASHDVREVVGRVDFKSPLSL